MKTPTQTSCLFSSWYCQYGLKDRHESLFSFNDAWIRCHVKRMTFGMEGLSQQLAFSILESKFSGWRECPTSWPSVYLKVSSLIKFENHKSSSCLLPSQRHSLKSINVEQYVICSDWQKYSSNWYFKPPSFLRDHDISEWPVINSLVIMHLWRKQEVATLNYHCLQWKLLQENWNLIQKDKEWGYTDLIFEQEAEHDNLWLNVYFGNDSCNNITIIWILSHM